MSDTGELQALAARRYDELENKAITGMTREQERDLARFIRRIGGYVQSGGTAQDVLDYDAPHFERAMGLIRDEVAPGSDAEVRELARWRAKYPPGQP
jgi:hypothetical protein